MLKDIFDTPQYKQQQFRIWKKSQKTYLCQMRQSQYTAQRQQINMDSELAELRELFATIEDKRAKMPVTNWMIYS